MRENFNAFAEGFIRGMKETPRGFFAPVIVMWKWLDRVTDPSVPIGQPTEPHDQKLTSR